MIASLFESGYFILVLLLYILCATRYNKPSSVVPCSQLLVTTIVTLVCLGSLTCWKMNLHPNLKSRALWSRVLSRKLLYIAAFIFLSILTSLLVRCVMHSLFLRGHECVCGGGVVM